MSASADHPSSFMLAVARRVSALDWLMLALAVISIGLLCRETFWTVDDIERLWLLRIDYAICALFAVEFLYSWRRAGWTLGYVARNWYEVLGMIPVSSPALRGFRLFRLLRIFVLTSRFGMALDRAWGDEFAYRLVNRFQRTIIDAIGSTVTLAVLDEVAEVLEHGRYAHNTARVVAGREDMIKALVLEKLHEDEAAGRLKKLPFYGDLTRTISDVSLRIVNAVLADPRTDALVADVLRENIKQLREAVRSRQFDKNG